jgi:hypothetical protein
MHANTSRIYHVHSCIHYYGHNVKDGDPKGWWNECKHIKGSIWLKDGVIQVTFIRWWRRLFTTHKTFIGLVEPWAKLLSLGLKHMMMQIWHTWNVL